MQTRKPKPIGRPSADVAEQIPGRILDAATLLFTRQGYARTSMEAIAKQAGASSKTIYARFVNKEEVLRAVVRRLFDRTVHAGEAMAPAPEGSDPRAFLIKIGHELAALSGSPTTAGVNRLIMAEAFQVPELAELFIELHTRARTMVSKPLAAWRDDGVLPDLPEVDTAALIFVEMVASIPRIRALLGRPLGEEETRMIVETGVDLFLRGCGYGR